MAHPLDNIRPKHALCGACGYRFGGIAIKDGVIVCPECGEPSRFDLSSHDEELERIKRRLRTRRVAAWIVLGLALICIWAAIAGGA